MSFGQQSPPPKTTDTGTIIGILALIFVGIPIGLCILGGLAIWAIAGFPQGKGGAAGGGWNFTTKHQAWQECIDLKKQNEQAAIAEWKRVIAIYKPNPPSAIAEQNINQVLSVNDRKLREKVIEVQRAHGPPPADVLQELQRHDELDSFIETAQREVVAAQQADQEQRMAKLRAEQAQREQQRLADMQARELAIRGSSVNIQPRFSSSPVFNPPVFNPPPAFNPSPSPSPAPQPRANQPPPGFPASDISQVKPKDIVFVQVGDRWVSGLVQVKRGQLVQIRAESGAVDVVTIDKIRLRNEPTAVATNDKDNTPEIDNTIAATPPPTSTRLPPALRAATPPRRSSSGSPEEEDDSLFVAKPGGKPASSEPSSPAPAKPSSSDPFPLAKKPAPAAEYRTWTNATGAFKVEAELINFEFDVVTLKRRDGKILNLQMNQLSADDQAVVRQKFP